MALTATASARTRKVILTSLCMHNREPCIITQVPNKLNITYSIQTKPLKKLSVLAPIIDVIKADTVNSPKTLIFCSTYTDCIEFFMELTTELDKANALNVINSEGKTEKVCAMFTGCTAESTKDSILTSFTEPSGFIRVVVATIAFGLGLDAPNIRTIIHWGPSKDIEAYVQESGRCGRDGKHSMAILYLSKSEQQKNDDDIAVTPMKQYCVNTTKCRRLVLMSEFAAEHHISQPHPLHNCCDICCATCNCDSCQEMEAVSKEDILQPSFGFRVPSIEPIKVIPPHATLEIKSKLMQYRSSLCSGAKTKDNGAITLIFGVEIATLLPDKLIERISQGCGVFKTVDDLTSFGVASQEQAVAILDIINSVLNKI